MLLALGRETPALGDARAEEETCSVAQPRPLHLLAQIPEHLPCALFRGAMCSKLARLALRGTSSPGSALVAPRLRSLGRNLACRLVASRSGTALSARIERGV